MEVLSRRQRVQHGTPSIDLRSRRNGSKDVSCRSEWLKRRSCDISDLERVPSEKVAGFTGSLERTLVVVAGTDSPFWRP